MTMKQIISPLPGTFYRKPEPDQPPYVEVGDRVSEGDVVGLVEVMKSYHEVKSDVGGTISAILVENESPITAGQIVLELQD